METEYDFNVIIKKCRHEIECQNLKIECKRWKLYIALINSKFIFLFELKKI